MASGGWFQVEMQMVEVQEQMAIREQQVAQLTPRDRSHIHSETCVNLSLTHNSLILSHLQFDSHPHHYRAFCLHCSLSITTAVPSLSFSLSRFSLSSVLFFLFSLSSVSLRLTTFVCLRHLTVVCRRSLSGATVQEVPAASGLSEKQEMRRQQQWPLPTFGDSPRDNLSCCDPSDQGALACTDR